MAEPTYVPEDAPFTPEQREWLNSFFAKLMKGEAAPADVVAVAGPAEPVTIESGATVRVLKAKLDSGEEVLVPRANVEIIGA